MRWDEVFLAIEYVALAAMWLILVNRFFFTLRRRQRHAVSVELEAWMTWGVYLVIALFGTFHIPPTRRVLREIFGAWVAPLPYIGIILGGYLLWSNVCYRIEPRIRPTWHWPLAGTLLTFFECALILFAAEQGALPRSIAFYRDTVVTALFSMTLLLIALHIVLPTFASSVRQEQQLPMRARLVIMAHTQAAVAFLALNEVVAAFTRIFGAHYNVELVRLIGGLTFILTLLTSYFLPARYFVWLVRRLAFLRDLLSVVYLRAFEVHVYRYLGRDAPSLSTRQALQAPDLAVYQSVVQILDARKLAAPDGVIPDHLAAELDSIADPDYDYAEVADRARAIGKSYVFHSLLNHVRLHHV